MKLLDLLGVEYIISYVRGISYKEQRTEFILAYISEEINALAQGAHLTTRLIDLLQDKPTDSGKSGDEIAAAFIKKHKLKVTNNELI